MRENQSIEASRAIHAAQEIARSFGLVVDNPVILAEGCAVRVHLLPSPVVARVSTLTALIRHPIEEWLRRELLVADFLHKAGAPVIGPSQLLPPGPHWHDGLCVSFWSYVKPAHKELPTPAVAGKMLYDLHQALRSCPVELPLLAPPLSDIPSSLVRIEARDAMPVEDLAMLRRTYTRLLARLAPEALGSLQPLHGDAHIYNMIATEDGWLWNDFEDVCLGPVSWDLASLATDDAALDAYPGVERESLALFREVRRLHGVCWWYALKTELSAWESFITPLVVEIRRADQV
jgi:hypothetical protein